MDDILQKLNIWGSWCRVVQFSETDLPVGRVGHTAHVLPLDCDPIGERLLIIIIGGADPSKVLNEAFALDMVSLKWYTVGVAEGIDFPSLGRYEHSSAILCDQRLLIFGGATKSGPLCQLLRLQIDVHSTMTPTMAATTLNSSVPPEIQSINASIKQDDNQTAIEQFIWKPRTQHSSVSLTEHDQLLIFSGGDIGSQTVLDEKVYMYDNVVNSWTIIPVEGISPCSRLGHLILYESPYELINSTSERIPKGNLYIHGGMAGGELFDDLYALHFEQFSSEFNIPLNSPSVWNKLFPTIHQNTMDKQDYSSSRDLISAKLVSPGPRAAHGGTILTNKFLELIRVKY
ncbi:unnamed protein product [Heterobilharzia americana]|nr:unnamed protein product [Heterobilharzia americana]